MKKLITAHSGSSRDVPDCFGAIVSPQQAAENGCVTCREAIECGITSSMTKRKSPAWGGLYLPSLTDSEVLSVAQQYATTELEKELTARMAKLMDNCPSECPSCGRSIC